MEWSLLLNVICQDLKCNGILEKITSVERNEKEVILCIINNKQMRNLLTLWMNKLSKEKYSKCSKKSKVYIKKGHKEFKLKNFKTSIIYYTKTMQYAILENEDYFHAAAYRSVSLFNLQKYEEALQDVHLALKWNECPNDLKFKLHRQSARCFLKLNKIELMMNSFKHAKIFLEKCNLSEKEKEITAKSLDIIIQDANTNKTTSSYIADSITHNIPKPDFGFNPLFPSASVGIDKVYTTNKGRHVITNRFIKKKQILFVEKPFSLVLLNHARYLLVCADCCHIQCNAPIPCTTCSDLIYCSVHCRNNAWINYHQWECPGNKMELWNQIGVAYLAINVFLKCATTSDIEKFNQVQSLVTNIDKMLIEDLLEYCITAVLLMLYLQTFTNFFNSDLKNSFDNKFIDKCLSFDCDLHTDYGKEVYISSQILRIILQMVCNAHSIINSIPLDFNIMENQNEYEEKIATGIYLSASMLNHSCDSNIKNNFINQFLIIKAAKDIPEKQEVFNCYGTDFKHVSRNERQEILKLQYNFQCSCLPCTDEKYEFFLDRFYSLKCSECDGAYCTNSLKCLDCGSTSIIKHKFILNEAGFLFDSAQNLLQDNKIEEALNRATKCLAIRQNVLFKYNENITYTLNLIGEIYKQLGHYLDSIEYLEKSLEIIEERFGTDSVQIVTVLNNIIDICILYLQNETNPNSNEYKSLYVKTLLYLERVQEAEDLNNGSWTEQYKNIIEKKNKVSNLIK